jgi:PAS domain S-box-containing protein
MRARIAYRGVDISMKTVFAHGFPAEMGLDSGAPGVDPLHQNLEATGALVRALLEQPSVPFSAVCDVIGRQSLPIFILDGPTHVLRHGNDAWRRVTGYSGPPGITLLELFPRLAGHPLLAALEHAYHHGEPIEVGESPFDRLGIGVPRFFSAAMQPYRDPAQGTVTGVVVVGVDLTAQVLARQLLSDVLQTIVWSGITGRGGRGRYNGHWIEYTGLSAEQSDEGGWQQIVHDDDLVACRQAFDEAVEWRRATQFEGRLRRCDGAYRWHRIRFALMDTGGQVVRWFGIASDIDDVRRTQEERIELLASERAARAEAEEANRQKDRFLAVVSDELRTPLGALLLWTKVLQDDPIDPDLRRRALKSIRDCTLAQARLVEDLLDISRVISGKLFLDPKLIDPAAVVQAGVEGARPAAAAKGLTLDATFKAGVGRVLADAGRLRQVVDNLLSNAIKFTDRGGRVSAVVRRNDGDVEIEVRDNGRGIRAEDLPTLFNPFSQGEETAMTRAQGGLGLGLAIARQLVELQGGSVRGESPGVGRGATFTVRLPMAPEIEAVKPPASGEPMLERLHNVRLLLVDDDPRVREPLGLLLQQEGADVECADSADAAWTALLRRPPQVLVSDVAMPGSGGDGYSLLRRVRDQAPEAMRDLPAVALTAHAREIDRARALDAGFDMHVSKPVDVDELVIGIGTLIARRRPDGTPPAHRSRRRTRVRSS